MEVVFESRQSRLGTLDACLGRAGGVDGNLSERFGVLAQLPEIYDKYVTSIDAP